MTSLAVVHLNLTESKEDLLVERLFLIYASSLYRNTRRTRFNFSFQKYKWTIVWNFCPYTARIIRDILDTYVTELHYDIYNLE